MLQKRMNRRIINEITFLANFKDLVNDTYIPIKHNKFFDKHQQNFKELKEKYNAIICNISGGPNTINLNLFIRNYKFNFKFILDHYPFRVPKIFLNNKSYLPCLNNKPKLLNSKECLCCQSITCYNNWNGTFNITQILLEYAKYDKLYFSRLRDKYNCKIYLCQKKIGFYLPIDEFL